MAGDPRVRANAAKRELRETQAAFDALRHGLLAKLLSSPAEATATRETCYFAINALDAVHKALTDVVAGGEIEDALAELTKGA